MRKILNVRLKTKLLQWTAFTLLIWQQYQQAILNRPVRYGPLGGWLRHLRRNHFHFLRRLRLLLPLPHQQNPHLFRLAPYLLLLLPPHLFRLVPYLLLLLPLPPCPLEHFHPHQNPHLFRSAPPLLPLLPSLAPIRLLVAIETTTKRIQPPIQTMAKSIKSSRRKTPKRRFCTRSVQNI